MSGTLPKLEGQGNGKLERREEGKETDGVPPLQLPVNDAEPVQQLNENERPEEQEEERGEEEKEEPLPPGWSEEVDDNGITFYWRVRDGRVSFDRPPPSSSEEEGNRSQASTARTNESLDMLEMTPRTQKTPSGAMTDRKKNQPVDEFEKLLREQMFNRQLKDALKLGDREVLRAFIVRYEYSKPPGDRQRNEYDEYDTIDADDVSRENDCDLQMESDFNDAKELLRTIDFYYYLIREHVLQGHWIQLISTEAGAEAGGQLTGERGRGKRGGGGGGGGGGGAGGRGARGKAEDKQKSPFSKAMNKFDGLSSQNPRDSAQQEMEDEKWLRNRRANELDPLTRQNVIEDINYILSRLKPKPDPPTPAPRDAKKPSHGVPRGPAVPPSGKDSAHFQNDAEGETEEAELPIMKRVRRFLRRQMDYLELLGQALRPRGNCLPILAMDKKTMAEIRSYASPKPIVHKVMQAVLLLVGYDEVQTASWGKCKEACIPDGKDGLNRRLMKFRVDELDEFIVERCWKILRQISFDAVQKASPGAATFYVWASSILRMRDFAIDDDSLEERLNGERMTQREIVRREQKILRTPASDDYEYRPPYPDTIYRPNY